MTVGPVVRNEASAGFFDAAARGRFQLLRCRPNGHVLRPQLKECPDCLSADVEPFDASGRARLVSWVVVPDRQGGEPLVPAIVELEEGPWWWTALTGADPGALTEGIELEVRFEAAEGGEPVPVFTPVAGPS